MGNDDFTTADKLTEFKANTKHLDSAQMEYRLDQENQMHPRRREKRRKVSPEGLKVERKK